MFGYIEPLKPELKIREYELFRAYYCGVCKSIGKRCGQLSRLALNYDSTFLAIFLSSLYEEPPCVKAGTCLVHPLKKRNIIANDDVIRYASDINVLLAYYNFEDKRHDEHSVLATAGILALRRAYKKLKAMYPLKCDIIEKRLGELRQLENEKCASMDKSAEPFGRLMEEVFAYQPLCGDEKRESALRWIGYNIGKWIYIADAFDDVEKDIRQKAYNPLLCQFEFKGGDPVPFKASIRERVEFCLTYSLSEIAKACQLLGSRKNAGIVENILYMGMLKKTEDILTGT